MALTSLLRDFGTSMWQRKQAGELRHGLSSASLEVDTLKITDDDAAFILGKGGKTKEKTLSISTLHKFEYISLSLYYMHIDVYVCVHMCVYACVQVDNYRYKYTYAYVFIYIYIGVNTSIHVNIQM